MVSKAELDSFEDYYVDKKGLIDKRIEEILDEHEDFSTTRKLLSHATKGGKRIRPVLTLASADVFGTPTDKALNHAAIVELIHNASLVSDDLIDGDDERRGKPTLWRLVDKLPLGKKGRQASDALTVMSQNGLLAIALELAEDPGVVNALGKSVRALVDGFFMEGREVFAGYLGGGYDRYIEINKAKTGGLYALSTWLPAEYVDATEEEIEAARKYGESAGILYQVTDDWADGDLPSFVDKPNEELEKWYDETISHIERLPESDAADRLRVAPAYMVHAMLEQEGMLDQADVHFLPKVEV